MILRLKDLAPLGLIVFCISCVFSGHSIAQQYDSYANSLSDRGDVPVVVLAALDKITTQLSTIEIRRNQTVRFGTLEITLRYCRANPPEETPESVAFLEIIDVGHNQQSKKVFSGWMFASSPALSPLEHPVYDVWVKECKIASGPAVSGKE